MTDQQNDDVVVMRPVYRETLASLRGMFEDRRGIVQVHRDVANRLDDLIKLTPEYREATTGGIKIESEADGIWRAWLTPDVQVVGSRSYVSIEVGLTMETVDRERGRTSPAVGGYKSIDRRHGVDVAEPGGDRPVVSAVAQAWIASLEHSVRENNRKITNLRNERNQARRRLEEEKAKAFVYYCDWCDEEFETKPEVTAHIETCEKHPLGAAKKEVERLEEAVKTSDAEVDVTYRQVKSWRDRAQNLERERDAQDAAFRGLQHEFDKVSKERDQLEEENKALYRVRDYVAAIARSLDAVENTLSTWRFGWRVFRRNRGSSTR